MGKEVVAENSMLIPRGKDRAGQFLGVMLQATADEDLGFQLRKAERGFRDKSIVLRGDLKLSRSAAVQVEVYADPQGSSLQIGWQATRAVVGGPLGNMGLGAELNAFSGMAFGKDKVQRQLNGVLQAFNDTVFLQVAQDLAEAVRQEQRPQRSGFA